MQNVSAPSQANITIPITETATLAYEGCAFVWASYEDQELTERLDSAVKELNPDAGATATLFGEDCIYADGTKRFGVMETDFIVRLTVDDLTKHEEFGNWIKDVMQIVTEIPREELQGNYGFVQFEFEKNETERIVFRVDIQTYLNEAQDKTGEELFNIYYTP